MLSIRRVLFSTDFSTGATRAFPQAVSFAARHDAELHVVNVPERDGETVGSLPVAPNVLNEWLGQQSSIRETHLEALTVVQRQLASGPPPERIVEYAKGHDIDLMVMGTHGRRGVRRLMLGSVTEEVLRTAPCQVLTVRADEENESRTDVQQILAPVDFSDAAESAVRHAEEIAETYDANLHLLHVIEEAAYTSAYGVDPPLTSHEEVMYRVEKNLAKRVREEIGDGRVEVAATVGYAPWTIVDYAKENDIDLIVIATHGRSGLNRILLGSVAERVLRRAPVPVFLVRPDQASLVPAEAAKTDAHDA